jgi:magnesium transporter
MPARARTQELNVARAHFGYEVRRRLPWILLSVVAGVVMIWIGQAYEAELSQKIELVFFVPVIVYMSDSIGTETLALFVRELALGRINIRQILLKEILVGLFLGFASGIPMGLFSYLWFKDVTLSATVATAMVVNGVVAVLVGMLIPIIFSKLGRDPALGTDEITTALSDNLSIFIYLVVATVILFGT